MTDNELDAIAKRLGNPILVDTGAQEPDGRWIEIEQWRDYCGAANDVAALLPLVRWMKRKLALQPCGHPAAAIRHGSGNPTTNYCGWCADIDGALDAGRKETRRVVVPVWSQRVAGEPDWRCPCGWRIGAFGRQVKYCPGCGAWLRWPKV